MLEYALWYQSKGYSVIPVAENKKCLIKWKAYQEKKASREQLEEWWEKTPNANIGLVTGKISNLTVIDIDTEEGLREIENLWPENLLTPTASTPSGGQHRYFKYQQGIGNSTLFLPGVDLRGEGGYIIVPPSKNGRGKYEWLPQLSIGVIELHAIPNNIYKIIKNSTDTPSGVKRGQAGSVLFRKGTRDESIFHVANHLVKGKMPQHEIEQFLTLVALKICDPPFPQSEIPIKIQSAFERLERRQKNYKEEIIELLRGQAGVITTSNIHNTLNMTSSGVKKAANRVLQRLAEEGTIIKKTGRIAGEYRIICDDLEKLDWKNAKAEIINLVLPLGMHECVRVMPGSILCFAGNTNAGKTAIAMEFAKNNQAVHRISYFTNETHEVEFRERAEKNAKDFLDWDIDLYGGWTSSTIQDVIEPDGINIIDYLDPPGGDFTQMATKLSEIHDNLRNGIAFINIQMRRENVVGGVGMMEKPHLFCTVEMVDYPVAKITFKKCKLKKPEYRNPYGLSAEFKVLNDGMSLKPYHKFYFEKWRE